MSTNLDATLSREFPVSGGKSTLEVTVSPLEKTRETVRQVVLVVDTSTSMRRGKVEKAREGVMQTLDEIEPTDQLCLISFNRSPDVLVEMQQWGDANQRSIRRKVAGSDGDGYDGDLTASGGTKIYKAMDLARSQFQDDDGDRTVSRDIILLSDGKDNRDLSDFEQLAKDMDDEGITVTAGGIGRSYKEDVLLAFTENTRGRAHHLEEADIDSFLSGRVKEAGDTIASDPELQLQLEDGFAVDEGEQVVLSEPTNETARIETGDDASTIDLPKLVVDQRQRLTLKVLGMPKQSGLTPTLGRLALLDDRGHVIAETTVDARYADDPSSKESIEKEREVAKIRADMTSTDAGEERVKEKIEDLEKERGWNDTAEKLRADLVDSSEHGGKIRVSKRKSDDAK